MARTSTISRRLATLLATVTLAVVAAGCLPLGTAGDTSAIQLVSSTSQGAWTYDYYRNSAYPCSVSGFQTFVVATRTGSSSSAARPLWAFLHGGGAGYFDGQGRPIPSSGQKVEESAAKLTGYLTAGGVIAQLRGDPAGFRFVAVSYCNHDVYGGVNNVDPNNPNTTPAGRPRLTNGNISARAAIQFVQQRYPTTDTFVHGGSAGSVGTLAVAWAMQLQGIPPAGAVADANVVNQAAFAAAHAQGVCAETNDPARTAAIAARVHPDLVAPSNSVDRLVGEGRLAVPVMHVWNHGDVNTCGQTPIECPMPGGTTMTLGVTDCIHEPLRAAIAAQGPTSRSRNLRVCVDNDAVPDCSVHVVTTKSLVNTERGSPVDYNAAIMDWVHQRQVDS